MVHLLQLNALVLIAIAEFGEFVLHLPVAAPQYDRKEQQSQGRKRWDQDRPEAPPGSGSWIRQGHTTRLGCNGAHQPVLAACRRLRTAAGEAQQAKIAAQRVQLATAGGT